MKEDNMDNMRIEVVYTGQKPDYKPLARHLLDQLNEGFAVRFTIYYLHCIKRLTFFHAIASCDWEI